jgi:hypothetical protein
MSLFRLKRQLPTYVAVWELKDKEICLVEVTYAGTHEKALYFCKGSERRFRKEILMDKEKEMKRISGGALRVPVISVCNEVMVGFDRGRLEQALSCLEQSSKIK